MNPTSIDQYARLGWFKPHGLWFCSGEPTSATREYVPPHLGGGWFDYCCELATKLDGFDGLVSGANASSGRKNCDSTHPKSCSFAPKTTSSPLSASMASSPGALEKNSPLVAPRQLGDLRGQAPTPRCVTWCNVRLLRSMFAILGWNEPLRLEVAISSWATVSCGRRSLASLVALRFCLTATMLHGGECAG